MKQSGSCSNCERGIKVNVNRDILCKIHGIVSRDFRCAKYIRKVEKWSAQENRSKCIECEFFIAAGCEPGENQDEAFHDPSVGHCQLFTVRQFNGRQKSACSKFCQKSERNIS